MSRREQLTEYLIQIRQILLCFGTEGIVIMIMTVAMAPHVICRG